MYQCSTLFVDTIIPHHKIHQFKGKQYQINLLRILTDFAYMQSSADNILPFRVKKIIEEHEIAAASMQKMNIINAIMNFGAFEKTSDK